MRYTKEQIKAAYIRRKILEQAVAKQTVSNEWTEEEVNEIKAELNSGSISRNEARSDLGLDPLEQADEVA